MGKHKKCVFVGGHMAVDFSNTIKMVNREKTDLLTSPQILLEWAEHFDLAVSYASLEEHFQEFIQLRNIIHLFFQDYAYRKEINKCNLDQFNAFIEEWGIYPVVSAESTGFPVISFQSKKIDCTLLSPIIESFLDIAGDENVLKRLKPCENAECVLLFIDTSKSQSRKWCSMAICGNKIKASNFYHRHRDTHA